MKPVLQSLLVADHIYEDKRTGKRVIAGIFGRILFRPNRPPSLPPIPGQGVPMKPGDVQHAGSPYAYISITEVRQPTLCSLRYVDLQTNEALFRADFSVDCHDPLKTVEITIPLPSLPTPHAGMFALELFAGDEPVGSLRINVEEIKENPGGAA